MERSWTSKTKMPHAAQLLSLPLCWDLKWADLSELGQQPLLQTTTVSTGCNLFYYCTVLIVLGNISYFRYGTNFYFSLTSFYHHRSTVNKDNLNGQVVRTIGKTAVGSVNLIKSVDSKFEIVRNVREKLTEAVKGSPKKPINNNAEEEEEKK